ncbi:hypothetical protein FIU88_08330 [Halomonas sp. THAF12]|uniref:hypothetical protein n=1 Tax=Halomonas sp. THAF12 TaxID=2587849 RepID=UPI0012A8A4B7|nr:hypothetical protein [Halomonas sp. THAF12]QFT84981.1 hypothetical protein FIU88_08330 [Halomonas sp. THAF12]
MTRRTRLTIPRRQPGEVAKARPCPGDPQAQLEKARQISMARYEGACRKLVRV